MSQRRGIPGRPPRAPAGGAGGPGNAGARGALLLAVAVILGIVLLQQFDAPDIPSGQVSATSIPDGEDDETTTTRRIGLTTVPQVTTTAGRARPKAEVKVLVANGAGVRGLGASTTNSLRERGYTSIATPTDTTTGVEKTAIQFVEGYEAEARELAGVLSLPATVVTRLASPPVAAADIGDAKLLVILGTDVSSASTTAPAGAVTTSTTRRP
jgi:hypothetical protein